MCVCVSEGWRQTELRMHACTHRRGERARGGKEEGIEIDPLNSREEERQESRLCLCIVCARAKRVSIPDRAIKTLVCLSRTISLLSERDTMYRV